MIRKSIVLLTLFLAVPFVLAGQQTDESVHIVQPGETLFSISRHYEVSVQELREWNRLPDHAIIPGQRLFISPGVPSQDPDFRPPADTLTHVVEPGQTLFRISRMYNVPVEKIQEVNQLEAPVLSIGQELIIIQRGPDFEPAPSEPSAAAADTVTDQETSHEPELEEDSFSKPAFSYYEVRPGDTLTRIASQFQMTVDEIMEMNNLDDTFLRVGDQLRIRRLSPVAPSVAADWDIESTPQGKFVNYRITRDDDIGQLLRYHQMDRNEFLALNPGRSLSEIRPGDEVTLILAATAVQRNPYLVRHEQGSRELFSITRYPDYQSGTPTTSGELYNPKSLTAAHPTLPLGTVVFVANPESGHGVYVLINDRTSDQRVKLSEAAFSALQFTDQSDLYAEINEVSP
ncbi:LysM peptidoglycan-binding domain-containing protein [Balneolaceae bacterium ANBcel3]|nr:LysM peptidoglycan-binding domain-containing protein [Balneolaceae bacterium ANBcel3]